MVLQIRHPIRRAAAGAFVALSLSSSVFAQESTVCAATAPVVDTVQGLREYVGSIWHASESLAVEKLVECDYPSARWAAPTQNFALANYPSSRMLAVAA
jgi:hypothetical protein